MEEELLSKVYQLKDSIAHDPRVIDLETKEKKMEEDEEVMRLSYRYSCAQNDYNDALRHYKEDSEELRLYQKKLYESKKELESHPLVRDYLLAYQKVRQMYEEMDEVLFSSFKEKYTCEEKK